jgi:indolepyruvate ferredoxin oxidoreductase beta subunit
MSDDVRSVLLSGVGGQGVVTASKIVADVLISSGYDVKQSEVHGMAQRGGSVSSHIRFGPSVSSPLVPLGSAEVLAAFEWAEALRWLPYVRPGGAVVADVRRIVPPGACGDRKDWLTSYPALNAEVIGPQTVKQRFVDATAVAADLGNAKAANSVILGVIAGFIGVPDHIWETSISKFVPPKTVDLNLAAFREGRDAPPVDLKPEATRDDVSAAEPPRIELERSWCKDCGICPRVCPEFCLAMDARGRLEIVDAAACTGCRLCEMLCPDFAITIHRDETAAIPVAPGGVA